MFNPVSFNPQSFNPLFFSSFGSFIIHAYLFFQSNNSFLLLPLLGTITSVLYHDVNFHYSSNLEKLDKSIITTSIFWNIFWITCSPLSGELQKFLILNMFYTLFLYYSSIIIHLVYSKYYNMIGFSLHFLCHLAATWTNVNIFYHIDTEPQSMIFKIGYTMCILAACNIVFRYIFREYRYNESYCTDYASKITSIIFQVIFCRNVINTLVQCGVPLESSPDSYPGSYRVDAILQSETLTNTALFSGYFCYDIISLLSTYRGSSQRMYLMHHFVSLYLIYLLYAFNVGNAITLYYINVFGLLFEFANPFLNGMKLIRTLHPESLMYYGSLQLSKITYFFSRIILLPICILLFYKDNVNIINPFTFYQIVIGLTGMCFLSIFWCTHLFALNQ